MLESQGQWDEPKSLVKLRIDIRKEKHPLKSLSLELF